MNAQKLAQLNAESQDLHPSQILDLALRLFPGKIAFANSFGLEDLVIQHLLQGKPGAPEPFVLDTGRLPAETYDLIERWRQRYAATIRLISPKPELLEPFVRRHGPNAFYQNPDLRQTCCAIRKLEPLERALEGKTAWITGLRREQSSVRATAEIFAFDGKQRVKVSPLVSWSLDAVWAYVRAHDLPYNVLHDAGYPSIGCAPCTRAVLPTEDIRAGRWWWEQESHRECGLHNKPKELIPHAHTSV